MKQALVLGITGSFGSHMARQLLAQGWRVTGIARNPESVPLDLKDQVTLVSIDVMDRESLQKHLPTHSTLIYGLNPQYNQWQKLALKLLHPSLEAAQAQKATLVFPGNVYGFNPYEKDCFDEQDDFFPISRKGKIRVLMEQGLRRASENGAQVIIMRAGDFIGTDSSTSWMNKLLKKTRQGYELMVPGTKDIPHCWASLPELAKTTVEVLAHREQLPEFNQFNFAGQVLSFEELAQAIEKHTQKPVKLKSFPWTILRVLGLISPVIREIFEMRYLWNQSLILNDQLLKTQIEVRYGEITEALDQAKLL